MVRLFRRDQRPNGSADVESHLWQSAPKMGHPAKLQNAYCVENQCADCDIEKLFI
jgi:hypothetical protein